MPAKSKKQQQLMGMVHNCQKTGKGASEKIKRVASSIKPADATDYAKTKHKQLPNKVTEGKNLTFKRFLIEGYKVLPSIDRDRYGEREGLEGPFRARNGKVYYYDKKEGKNYDPDSDMYISHQDFETMDR